MGVLENLARRADIRAFHNAVARDVRVDNDPSTEILELLSELERADVRIFGPNGELNVNITRVNPNCDVHRVAAKRVLNEGLVLYGSGAQNDAPDSQLEQSLDKRHAANSTTDLNLCIGDGGGHLAQDALMLRPPLKRSVQI